jgi:hypothetical protein
MKKTIRYIWGVLFGMLLSCGIYSCIKNDIPYPRIQAQIVAFEVEGQVGQAQIDATNQVVSVQIADTVDLKKVKVTRFEITPDATASATPDVVDLSSPIKLTLSIYQDYEWTIRATQQINRIFTVDGQIGQAVFDPYHFDAFVQVSLETDLAAVRIRELMLGPADQTTQSPSLEMLSDFSRGGLNVEVRYRDIVEQWTLHVLHTDADIITGTADAWSNVAWLHGTGMEGATNGFEYREADSETWIAVPDAAITHNGSEFTAKLIHLKAETTYRYRAVAGEKQGEEKEFTTGSAPQLPNSTFDEWYNSKPDNSGFWTPSGGVWDSGNKGSAILNTVVTMPTEDTWNGKGKAVYMESKFAGVGAVGKLGGGNVFLGEFIDVDGTNGIVHFGRPFTERPTRIRGHFKYSPKIIDKTGTTVPDDKNPWKHLVGRMDTCHIFAFLGDWGTPFEVRTNPYNQRIFNKQDPGVIAYAEVCVGEEVPEYIEFTLEFEYRATDRKPTHMAFIATASKYADFYTGAVGSKLYVDDIWIEYDYDE